MVFCPNSRSGELSDKKRSVRCSFIGKGLVKGKLVRDGPTDDLVRNRSEIRCENPDVDPFGPGSAVQGSIAHRGETSHGLTEVVEDVPSSG